jgi:hypothetical protein
MKAMPLINEDNWVSVLTSRGRGFKTYWVHGHVSRYDIQSKILETKEVSDKKRALIIYFNLVFRLHAYISVSIYLCVELTVVSLHNLLIQKVRLHTYFLRHS